MITNPYVWLGAVVFYLASLVGVGLWQRHDGAAEVRVSYETRDNASLQAANSKILALEESARNNEQAHAVALSAIASKYTKELQDANAQKDRDVAAARAGALKLRYTVQSSPDERKLPDPPAPSGGSDGPQTAELSTAVTEQLFALADDADQVAKQLASCQAVVEADRK